MSENKEIKKTGILSNVNWKGVAIGVGTGIVASVGVILIVKGFSIPTTRKISALSEKLVQVEGVVWRMGDVIASLSETLVEEKVIETLIIKPYLSAGIV